jgi:glycosyltransferase involved in cell wall biosynthesis
MKISVIICTHNPREEFLRRTLESLRSQTLSQDQWELLLIDNASHIPLAGRSDISWQPHSRHVREDELGLTPARLRGIQESKADILVFADDDTVLASNYLEQALVVAGQWPIIGAWGGGISPEFEIDPPSWCLDQPWRLTILDVKEDVWSNVREGFATIPAGAGMCIRKNVGMRFVEWCRINGKSKILDRTGTSITGYGDADLAHCAMDIGLGTGRFTCLHLTHLIPASRLTLDYLLRHAEGDAASFMMFRAIRGLPVDPPDFSFLAEVRWRIHRLLSRKPAELIKIQEADRKGRKIGWKLIQQHLKTSKPQQVK